MSQGGSWRERLVGTCVVLLGCALALDWAWRLLRPLLPLILGGVVAIVCVGAVVRAAIRRREYW
jgi:hypothetical protein